MPEVERKYTGEAVAFVDLSGLVDIGPTETFTLRATHVDTPDHRLAQAGWVLRRREGGKDAGWHLKSPLSGDARDEIAFVDADRLPAQARALVTAEFGAVPLVEVAVLVTERAEQPLLRDGVPVAFVAADQVAATASGVEKVWAEWEVEVAPGADAALLDLVEPALLAAGLVRAAHGSKIERALADVPRYAVPTDADAPARDVLLAYLGRQVGTIQALDEGVRVDAPDAVHKSRVATRRLRSLLRTFEPLLDDDWAESLRGELRWLAELLGAPRDAEVLTEEFGDLLAELGPESLEGPVAHRILTQLAERHGAAHEALRAAMTEPRYRDLHARLVALLTAAPWLPDADLPARDVLPPLVDVAVERVRTLAAKARRRPTKLALWHEVRKAAKAARYCTEALVDAFGAEAAASAKLWTEVTEAFGVLQDAVVARELIAEVKALAEAAHEPTRTYGVLADTQDDRAETSLVEGLEVLTAALADR